MEARETDKLFREKLKNAPSAPKAESWEQLETMLAIEEKAPIFTFWRVAAAILLLIVSGLVMTFWSIDSDVPSEVAIVALPSESIQNENVIIPEAAIEEEVSVDEAYVQVESKKQKSKPVIKEQTIPIIKVKKEEESLETKGYELIEEQTLAQAEISTSEIEEAPQKKKIKTIKITYKRGSTSLPKQEEMIAQQKLDTTGNKKIKELWDQTREIKPGDLWADIREAKDNLFQRNSKKNNVKNLNK